MNKDIGPQSSSDSKFVRKCRLHQSKYRAEILNETYGFGPTKNSTKRYGNMLEDGEHTGSNFLTDTAFQFAKQKVLDKQIHRNYLLTYLPLC